MALPDFSSYVAAHRARRAAEARAREVLADRARTQAAQAAERIAQRTAATEVWLFGSLCRDKFGARSDIDLAVEGLAPGRLVDALAAAERGCDFPVDVLPLDQAAPEIRTAIKNEGFRLWPR